LWKDIGLIVNFTAATEVEAIDAGTKMRAISLRTGKREHTHTGLAAPSWHAGQVSDVSSRACKNEGIAIITSIYDELVSDQNLNIFLKYIILKILFIYWHFFCSYNVIGIYFYHVLEIVLIYFYTVFLSLI